MEWWIDLSAGQGSALSGLLTAIGAVLGIVIASKFFSGKVKTLREALEESQSLLEVHSSSVKAKLADIEQKIATVDAQAGSLSLGVARIESNVIELTDSVDETAPEPPSADAWSALRTGWFEIRDELDRRASAEDIDGRTRAAYGRVDRRLIYELIERMREKRDLSARDARAFDEAFQIWNRYKNRRKVIDEKDLKQLAALRRQLVPASS